MNQVRCKLRAASALAAVCAVICACSGNQTGEGGDPVGLPFAGHGAGGVPAAGAAGSGAASSGSSGSSGSPSGGGAQAGDGSGTGGGGTGAGGEPNLGGADGGPDGGTLAPAPSYVDPGTGPWQAVPADQVAEVCKLDPELLAQADQQLNVPWLVVRYGRLCHEFYPAGQSAEDVAEAYSTTKSLGAVVVGLAAFQTKAIPVSGRKTGPLSDWDRVDHWLDGFSYNPEAHVAHVLAMVAHNPDLAYGAKQHAYDTAGDVQINSLSDIVNTAIAQDSARLGSDIEAFTRRFLFEPLGMTQSAWSDGAADKVFAYTWSTSIREMARVGLLVLNRGHWNGQRVLDEEWVYKMTHPAFEDGNTAYGYLTWLSSLSNHSIGFSPPTAQGPSIPCTPAALWPHYPHGMLSMAPDCNYEAPYPCEQTYDVGVSQAVGLGGHVIQVHPGLDLVAVVRDEALGGAGLWPALYPALVKLDPTHLGDETAFCEAYSSNAYAPDLAAPWPAYP